MCWERGKIKGRCLYIKSITRLFPSRYLHLNRASTHTRTGVWHTGVRLSWRWAKRSNTHSSYVSRWSLQVLHTNVTTIPRYIFCAPAFFFFFFFTKQQNLVWLSLVLSLLGCGAPRCCTAGDSCSVSRISPLGVALWGVWWRESVGLPHSLSFRRCTFPDQSNLPSRGKPLRS